MRKAKLTKNIFDNVCAAIINTYKTSKNHESILRLCLALGRYAYKQHPGVFFSDELESIILSIGNCHLKQEDQINCQPSKDRHVLHICSQHYSYGGHSRLLENWIEYDQNKQSVLITNKSNGNIDYLQDLCSKREGLLHVCESSSYLEIIKNTFNIIKSGSFTQIILHTHPEDVCVIAALSRVNIPTIFINHSDHSFWFGKNIANLFVNIRSEAANINYYLRNIHNNFVLSLPLRTFKNKTLTKADARKLLGINHNLPIAVSIGSKHKFFPNTTNNFFDFLQEVWEKNKNLHIYIIGIDNTEFLDFRVSADERLHFCGKIPEPDLYCIAADFVIDPIPKGSYTASLEAASMECYPILFKNGIKLFDLAEDIGLKDLVYTKDNYSILSEDIEKLTSNAELLKEKTYQITKSVKEKHSINCFTSKIKEIYQITEKNTKEYKIEYSQVETDNIHSYLAGLNNTSFSRDSQILFHEIFTKRKELPLIYRISLFWSFRRACSFENNTIKFKTFIKFILF